MSEVIPFVSKAERERARLIREARAIYDSIFPAVAAASDPQDVPTTVQTININVHREGAFS
ncbi:MAG: hypothetical protein JO098_00075 [Candidatus Eremiobacteraeota bacterium]|nr:hypothetical protein [Candidatus Eremiobacteraeota bacterium]